MLERFNSIFNLTLRLIEFVQVWKNSREPSDSKIHSLRPSLIRCVKKEGKEEEEGGGGSFPSPGSQLLNR